MTMIKKRSDSNIAFGAEAIILIALFALICAILTQVFARAAELSNDAGNLNNAVQICRNAAEIYRNSSSFEEAKEAVGIDDTQNMGAAAYDEKLNATTADKGVYSLTASEVKSNEDDIESCIFSVYKDGELIYSLQTSRVNK